jgi:hypothetical protein
VKYALHCRTDGELGERLSELLDTEEQVKKFIVDSLQKGELEVERGGYSIETYDDEGNLVELVPEEEAKKAAEQATELVEKNDALRQAVGSMIASRQLYIMCVEDIERLLDKMSRDGQEIHPMVIEVLIQTAAAQAAEPFHQVDLLQGYAETVMPWLHDTVARHMKEDKVNEMRDAHEYEEERRKTKVDIGIPLDPGRATEIDRGKPVVFVGYKPVVKIVLDHVVNAILTARVDLGGRRIIKKRFMEEVDPASEHPRIVRVPKGGWENCAKNSKGIPTVMGKHVIPQLKRNPDALVCDDLMNAYEGTTLSRPPSRAAEAMRRFKQWTSKAGCALIGGMPLPEEKPVDMRGTQWERLTTHAVVRPLTLIRKADDLDEDKYRILVGRDAFTLDVDAKLFRGNLILPE